MRELDPTQLAVVTGPVTAPCYLIAIELDRPYFWTTRTPVTMDVDGASQTFVKGGVKLSQISLEGATLAVDNRDDRHTDNALDGDYARGRVRIWWAYGPELGAHYVTPGYWEQGYTVGPDTDMPDPILCFDGIIYATPQIGAWLTIDARREPARLYPFARIRPPRANHLPRAGYTVTFDGTVLIVESER